MAFKPMCPVIRKAAIGFIVKVKGDKFYRPTDSQRAYEESRCYSWRPTRKMAEDCGNRLFRRAQKRWDRQRARYQKRRSWEAVEAEDRRHSE